MTHGDAREGKWRWNWRMEWVASTLHTTSEHDVSSITTAHAHTSADSSRLKWRPRGGAVGWGTALHAGRSRVQFQMVSLEFFIDIILPVALWPWGWISLWQKWVPGIFLGGKGGRCVRLTNLPPSCADCLEMWEPQPSGTLRACNGTALTFVWTRCSYTLQDSLLGVEWTTVENSVKAELWQIIIIMAEWLWSRI